MAILTVAERADATTTSGGSSWSGLTMAAGASITPGNTLVMTIAARDSATPPIDGDLKIRVGDTLCADLRGNLWRLVATASNEGASTSADDGAVSYIWVCNVVYPYQNGDAITLYAPITSRPMTHVAARIVEYSRVLRTYRAFASYGATGNGTAVSLPGITPTLAGQMVIATAAVASNPTLTGDADGTGGSWTAIDQATSGASGIRRGDQAKELTSVAGQTWDVTWTGTQRWAATAIIIEEAVYPWPYDNTYLANPNFECPAGPEILPVDRTTVSVDTGTAYIFETSPPLESAGSSGIYWNSTLLPPRADVDTQHGVCCEVYLRGQEQERNDPFIFSLGTPNFVAASSGGVVVVGGGTAVDALASAGGTYLLIPGGDYVDLLFDASGLSGFEDEYRVLSARLEYVAWKDDSADAASGEGVAVYWRDLLAFRSSASFGATRLHGAWLVNEYQPNARYVTKNLGEVNGYPRFGTGNGQMVDALQACWTIRDFLRMVVGDTSTMIRMQSLSGSFPSQQQIYLDTVRLQLVVVKETRLAHSVRRISTGVGFPNGADTLGGNAPAQLPMFNAVDTSLPWTAPDGPTELSVVIREPLPSSGSDWFAAQSDPTNITSQLGNYRYASMEQVGPSVVMRGIVQPRETLSPEPTVKRAEWSLGQIAENAEVEPYGEIINSVTLFNAGSLYAWWPYYLIHNYLGQGPSASTTIMQEIAVDGGTEYDTLKVLVKPGFTTEDDLTFSIEQPTSTVLAVGTVSVADVLALPDVGNGYREVHVPLSTTISPAAGTVEVYALSTTPDNASWIIGSATSIDGRTIYSPDLTQPPADNTNWAMALCCPLNPLDVSIDSSTITNNASGTDCAEIETVIPCITVENGQDYDWISIERYVSNVDRTPVALIPGAFGQGSEVEIVDTFGRAVSGGWGDADTGQTWQLDTPADFSVAGGRGVITFPGGNQDDYAAIPVASADMTAQVTVDVPTTPTGGDMVGSLEVRQNAVSGSTQGYYLVALFQTNGTVDIELYRTGSGSPLDGYTLLDYIPGTGITLKLQITGDVIRAKGWLATGPEPDNWYIVVVDSTWPTAGYVRLGAARATGNTSPDPSVYFDDFSLSVPVDVPVEWCDYGVPWDIPAGELSYVLQGFRDHDRRTTDLEQVVWNDVSVNPGAAFGLATEDALYVYVPVSDSGELEIEWNPLNPLDQMPLHGKDYQIALRSPEDRGVEVTVNVIVNKLSRCTVVEDDTAFYDESNYDEGFLYS